MATLLQSLKLVGGEAAESLVAAARVNSPGKAVGVVRMASGTVGSQIAQLGW
jgi:hypothetical protein